MGVSLNGGTVVPPKHPKMIIFLVGKAMVVGGTHHFRKPRPYSNHQRISKSKNALDSNNQELGSGDTKHLKPPKTQRPKARKGLNK